jgi:hypothetical protein
MEAPTLDMRQLFGHRVYYFCQCVGKLVAAETCDKILA